MLDLLLDLALFGGVGLLALWAVFRPSWPRLLLACSPLFALIILTGWVFLQ